MSTACQSATSTGTAPRSSPQERRGRAVLLFQWSHREGGTMRCVAASRSTSVNMSFPEGDRVAVDKLMIIYAGHSLKLCKNELSSVCWLSLWLLIILLISFNTHSSSCNHYNQVKWCDFPLITDIRLLYVHFMQSPKAPGDDWEVRNYEWSYIEINKNTNFCCFVTTISFCTHTFPALSLPITPFTSTSEFPQFTTQLLTTEPLSLSKCGCSDFLKGSMEVTGSVFNSLACCSQEPHHEIKLTEPHEKVTFNLGSNVHESKRRKISVRDSCCMFNSVIRFIDLKDSLYSSKWDII